MNGRQFWFPWLGLTLAGLLSGCVPVSLAPTARLQETPSETQALPLPTPSPWVTATATSLASPTALPSPSPSSIPPVTVYTQDAQGNVVIALDGETGEVIARIRVDAGPHDIALCRPRGMLFTGNIEASTVSVIDVAAHAVVRTLSAGPGAHGVALDPDCRRLYVANAYADTVSVFDLTDFHLLKEVPVGDFPEYVAVHPEGQWVLTTNLGGPGSVTHIDGSTLIPVRTFRLGSDPHGLALSPDGTQLAIAQLGSSQVFLLDAQTLEVVATYETGAISEWAAFRSPRELWVTNIGADYVSLIDLEVDEVVAQVTTGLGPHGIAFARGGRWAFVSNMKEGTVVKIDALTRQVTGRFAVGGELHNLVISD